VIPKGALGKKLADPADKSSRRICAADAWGALGAGR